MLDKVKNNKLIVQIFKFLLVGGTATVIDFIIFFLLHEILSVNTLVANVTSFSLSLIYNYFISILWVFETDKDASKKQQFIIFLVFSLMGLGINTAIVYFCTDILKLYSMIGKIIATAIVMVFNFVTRKIFLERKS